MCTTNVDQDDHSMSENMDMIMRFPRNQLFAKKSKLSFILGVTLYCGLSPSLSYAEDNWTLNLKNAYIQRDNSDTKDMGSWSQGVSLFYKSDYYQTPIQDLEIGVDGSAQYAVRLSKDKHVADTVLPFDKNNQKQASDYSKYGITAKLKYNDTELRIGELWLDLPVTAVDRSRQLLTSYWGTNIHSKINDQFSAEIGRVTKVSARNDDEFENFSFTQKGKTYSSDGLNYLNLRYDILPNLKAEYYFGNLEDLYNKHYIGLQHTWTPQAGKNLNFVTKLKYFNSKEDNKNLEVDSQNYGILETMNLDNHSFGLGYQQIAGESAYPLPDGFLPETYFINWNTTGFFKKDEKSYHVIYKYDFKNYIPGFNAMAKYVYGNNFKTAQGLKNSENETNLVLNYAFQQPVVKGLALQFIRIDYDVKHGNDFSENRFFVNYTKKF